jgi:hypothetical protein
MLKSLESLSSFLDDVTRLKLKPPELGILFIPFKQFEIESLTG